MKTFASRILLTIGLLLFASMTASAQALPPFSNWQNDKGSILNVTFVTGNTFAGLFTNRAQGYGCQFTYPVDNGTIMPNGNISFSVNFVGCDTVTRWRGHIVGSKIPTKWVLVYKGRKFYGADVFTRLPF
jgi:hypothetical protein